VAFLVGGTILAGLLWFECGCLLYNMKNYASVLLVGCLAAYGLGFWCRRRIGGITGDLLRGTRELIEVGVLLIGAHIAHVAARVVGS